MKKNTVLVVQDSPTQAQSLAEYLQNQGFRVQIRPDAEGALEYLQRATADVMLSDIVMPVVDGYELCRQVKAKPKTRGMPVILLTSLSDSEDVLKGLECGADNFITKPVDFEFLHARLDQVLGSRRSGPETPALSDMEVFFHGKTHRISASRLQILDLLLSSYENAVQVNRRLLEVQFELKRLDLRLSEQKMEAVGRLAGGVVHDFNNMLMVIDGFAGILAKSFEEGDQRLKYLGEIRKAVDRASTLTNQLLAFSGKQVLQEEDLNLNDIVEDTVGMVRRLIGENIECTLSLNPGLNCVRSDKEQIVQVLINLVVNARDAMPQGGGVGIATYSQTMGIEEACRCTHLRAGDYVVLAVSDTGEGMTQEVQQHIYEPFFTTREKGKGTGLGLSMVYGIVKQSRGFIDCESAPGEGTTFKVYLPRVEGSPKVTQKGRKHSRATKAVKDERDIG
jgi:signal transduction histidine kinase